MHTKKISFENSPGHRLAALLDLPVDDAPIAYALFAHCFTCSKSYKGWPLEAVEVRLHHEKIHCEDCADPERPASRIDHFTREIVLEGPLDDKQRDRLLKIADRCPVHRTLEKPAEITTRLAVRP